MSDSKADVILSLFIAIASGDLFMNVKMIDVRCPNCRSILAISTLEGRKEIRCERCHVSFDVPSRGMDDPPEGEKQLGILAPSVSRDAFDSAVSVTPVSDDGKPDEIGESVPQILHEDMARAKVERGTPAWWSLVFGIGILFSCVALLIQYTWFHSVEVLQRFPDLRPRMEALCESIGCRVPVGRDPTRVQIIDRDVRAHPKYERALLVSARLVNTLPNVQPFPYMQLELFDVGGRAISARIFEPKEYLDGDMDITVGMESNKPVQVVLGILAREEAVGFEFTFL
uniref:MJ0042 family finger-like domain-containing protein n=1 Tax=Candidatus Kentrum sp. SD TaxID=2126332 RepID=A0A450YIJ9_9GAMM|nr:MAG: Protein of unknown function (DUF3426) [Candidatus Kentron sp. SD]VFK47197.1 MAG: Protein of unknown function (DUF3426) [Candidatus Kentron sp. SD]